MHNSPVLITDFSNLAAQKWRIVNDDVMGGASTSQFQINEEGNAVFLGEVSFENNGGFASVKNDESLNLVGFKSVQLRVKGDGKRYSFRLKPQSKEKLPNYWFEARFDSVQNQWIEVVIPIGKFRPTYRGRTPDPAPTPDWSTVHQFGFLISNRQGGHSGWRSTGFALIVRD
ncbi:CIA30 family protein [Rhodohalobacter halophilus]|uniref:CIA30 family protein n=1 Tax=Rhodohalobacter halophilus TaxID=1812810 RepID=UPI0015B78477|nr:CIA30 family protein [Rhodohalobacter halophilus]